MFGPPAFQLQLSLAQDTVFLRPSKDPETVPSEDPIVHGQLILKIAKPRKLTKLAVHLVCDYSVRPGPPNYRYLEGRSVVSYVCLHPAGEERIYPKGEHVLAFSIVVPSSTAPYESSAYGVIQHKVLAIAKYEDSWKMETSVPFFLAVNPAPVGEASGFNISIQESKPTIGPYALEASAQHLQIGNLLHFSYTLASLPADTHILSMSAFLDTSSRITSPTDPSKILTDTIIRTPLFEADGAGGINEETVVLVTNGKGEPVVPDVEKVLREVKEAGGKPKPTALGLSGSSKPFQVMQAGGSIYFSHLARLPTHGKLSPSTLKGTRTPIDIEHQLYLEIRCSRPRREFESVGLKDYTTDDRDSFGVSARVPVTIVSCRCMLSSVLVPAYSTDAACSENPSSPPSTRTGTAGIAGQSWPCSCDIPTSQLLEQHSRPEGRIRETHESVRARWTADRTADAQRRRKEEYQRTSPIQSPLPAVAAVAEAR